MTRSPTVLAFTLLATMLIAVSAWAQSDGGRTTEEQAPKAGGDRNATASETAGLELLRLDPVRSDLRITDEQERKLMGLGGAPELKPKDLLKQALAILTPKQRQRLKQIRLQALGPLALADPVVIKALDVTEEQRKMVKALPAQLRRATREALQEASDANGEERSKIRAEVRAKLWNTALQSLTPEQREKLDKMEGKKIDVDFLGFGL